MRRLGKQRVEAFQILNILKERTSRRGWGNHPAVRMWRGYENALCVYTNAMIAEWKHRGYRNTMSEEDFTGEVILPPWFGEEAFHASHRSNLLRKDFMYYSRMGWKEPLDLPYVWPT